MEQLKRKTTELSKDKQTLAAKAQKTEKEHQKAVQAEKAIVVERVQESMRRKNWDKTHQQQLKGKMAQLDKEEKSLNAEKATLKVESEKLAQLEKTLKEQAKKENKDIENHRQLLAQQTADQAKAEKELMAAKKKAHELELKEVKEEAQK